MSQAEINLFEKDEVDECTAPLMELHTTCIRFLKLEREALTWCVVIASKLSACIMPCWHSSMIENLVLNRYKDIARHHFSKLAVKIQNSITAATHSCANRADLYCKVARVFSGKLNICALALCCGLTSETDACFVHPKNMGPL